MDALEVQKLAWWILDFAQLVGERFHGRNIGQRMRKFSELGASCGNTRWMLLLDPFAMETVLNFSVTLVSTRVASASLSLTIMYSH